MSQDILFDVVDRVATITLNRPEKRNAFTLDMADAWADRLEECHAREDVHVVIITGAGKAFCAGGDIDALMRARLEESALEKKRELTEHIHRIPRALKSMDKPVLAAINGSATGAGLDLALLADIRYAAESARFAETYVKVGIVPGAGGAYILPRRIGTALALEMLWTGDFVDAHEAERIGLVNKVLPDDALLPHTQEMAQRIADGPTLAVRMIKRAVYQSQDLDFLASLDLVSSHYGIAATGPDHREAVDAFIEKRAPRFQGR